MSRQDKEVLRPAIGSWMHTMDWPFIHAARWLIRRQRRGLLV